MNRGSKIEGINDANCRPSFNQVEYADGRDPIGHETDNNSVNNYQRKTTMVERILPMRSRK